MATTIRFLILLIWFIFLKLLSEKIANVDGKHCRANITYWFAVGVFLIGQLYGTFLTHIN